MLAQNKTEPVNSANQVRHVNAQADFFELKTLKYILRLFCTPTKK